MDAHVVTATSGVREHPAEDQPGMSKFFVVGFDFWDGISIYNLAVLELL